MPTLFNINEHHAFVARHGEELRWYRSHKCPCGALPDANRSRTTCVHCLGTGLRYDPPVNVIGIVTQKITDKNLIESGTVSPGDMLLGLSPLEKNVFSDWDMVELNWKKGEPFEGELIARSSDGAVDTLQYPAKDIFDCVQINHTTQTIIHYSAGTNFTVSGRTLTWIEDEDQPNVGDIFSIKYTAIFQWVCFRGPFDRREQDINLGQKVLLKKRHLVFQ